MTIWNRSLTSSIKSKSVVSILIICLPSAFSIWSICCQVFWLCTKLIDIPLLPKRPVRPEAKFSHEFSYDCEISLEHTNTMQIGFHVWFITGWWCSTLVHQWYIIINHHVDLWNVDTTSYHVGRNQDLDIGELEARTSKDHKPRTLSLPDLKASMTVSRSIASFAPCNDATLCPSAVIRFEILSAVCRC